MPAMFAETVSASGKPVKLPVFAFRFGAMSDFRYLQQHWHFKYRSVGCGCCMACSSHGFVCCLLSSLTTLCSKVMGKSLRFPYSPKSSTFALLPDCSIIFQVPLCGLRLPHGMQFAWICLLPAILIDYALLKSYGKIAAILLLSKKQRACSSA